MEDKLYIPYFDEIVEFTEEQYNLIKKRLGEKHMIEDKQRHGMPEFYKMLEEMADTHDRKSHDYASNNDPSGNYHFAGKIAQLFVHSYEDAGFVGRLAEKIYRLANLESGQKTPLNETIEDTERDICVITVMWMADRKTRRNTKLENIKKIKEQMNSGTWQGLPSPPSPFPPNREIREGDIPRK